MTASEQYNDAGCINLIGAIIHQAITEYSSKYFKKTHRTQWDQTKHFLFGKGVLESFLERFHLLDSINVENIRKLAVSQSRKPRRGRVY